MDIFAVLFLSCISILIGVILTLVGQYYILYVYLKKSPVAKPPHTQNNVDYTLPEGLKKQLENEDIHTKTPASSLAVSLILQFLFHELRHSEYVKCWLYKKLSLEFDELLNKTTIGKFFEVINIKDMHLGSQFPDLKNVTVDDVKMDKKEGYLETINLGLDLEYTGNFMLSIDAKMKFGKTAYLSIKVKRISGLARLQFTRHPYTHWSFSFYNDPTVELAVESHFQGRQLQSNITNLIVNQIKKAIKRKHTLPNYKIRYKPFFMKTDPSQLDSDDSEIVPQGQLDVTCIEITRLSVLQTIQNIYYTISVDTLPWICIYNKDSRLYMILEVTMSKLRQAQLGVIFKQDQGGCVMVESIAPHSCASRSGLKPGDIVLAVESKTVNSVPQVAKLIKSISAANITLRVERFAENYAFKSKHDKTENKSNNVSDAEEVEIITSTEQDNYVLVDSIKKDGGAPDVIPAKKPKPVLATAAAAVVGSVSVNKTPDKVPKLISNSENVSKIAQTLGNFSLRKRKASVSSEKTSNDSTARNTPNSSNPSTPQHTKQQQHSLSVSNSSGGNLCYAKKHSISEVPEIVRTDLESMDSEVLNDATIETHKGKELPHNPVLAYNEDYQFNLKEGSKYLNINVWGNSGGSNDKDILLGYTNIPLSHILNECCNCVLGHYMRSYSFLPPANLTPNSQVHPLMSHSGFEHVFCYGDILLSFVWTHEEDIELKRKMSAVNVSCDDQVNDPSVGSTKHDFIRTQFHRTTHCDFCSKKIWLKDAVQCRECGLCCHKKCIAKCQISNACVPVDRNSLKSDNSDTTQPEITMTEVMDDMSDLEHQNKQSSSGTSSVMKRVNSVNNLAIPGSHVSPAISRSLPPSPQRTPSRKQSLVQVNPFTLCPNVLEEVQKQNSEAAECLNKLLEQVMLCPADETLMDQAKETGQQLYVNIPHEDRVEKINVMVSELKKALDTVTLEHMELSKRMSREESEMVKTKLAFLIGQADAKVHGLSVLMLHYCSSLQHSQEKIV